LLYHFGSLNPDVMKRWRILKPFLILGEIIVYSNTIFYFVVAILNWNLGITEEVSSCIFLVAYVVIVLLFLRFIRTLAAQITDNPNQNKKVRYGRPPVHDVCGCSYAHHMQVDVWLIFFFGYLSESCFWVIAEVIHSGYLNFDYAFSIADVTTLFLILVVTIRSFLEENKEEEKREIIEEYGSPEAKAQETQGAIALVPFSLPGRKHSTSSNNRSETAGGDSSDGEMNEYGDEANMNDPVQQGDMNDPDEFAKISFKTKPQIVQQSGGYS